MSPNDKRPVRVAVDAMGGDFAPTEVVQGAVDAAKAGDVHVLLVGTPDVVQPELVRCGGEGLPVMVVPSEGVIQEGESPIQALRQNPRASIAVAVGAVKAGHADAAITMGSTGAAMAAGAFALGLMEGFERPALGGPILGPAPNTVILDLGSSLDCRPELLLRYAALGTAFARTYLGVAEPRVALLSVGAEEGKGNRQVREAYELLKRSPLRFVGNVEGHDLAAGAAEVVVCDGFVGNVVMKLAEGLGDVLSRHLASRLEGLLPADAAQDVARETYDLLNRALHVGAGPLFGVKGLVLVGHGRSKAQAVTRAIQTARHAVEVGLVRSMEEELAQVGEAAKAS